VAAAAILNFQNMEIFNGGTAQEGGIASPCQISFIKMHKGRLTTYNASRANTDCSNMSPKKKKNEINRTMHNNTKLVYHNPQ